jgi:sugar O-acyltransferase (sialic acid O-acetyltransferase NeuD family)
MIVVGAKGFAKEILELLYKRNELENVAFFDNISTDISDTIFDRFPVLRTNEEVHIFFERYGNKLTLGVGAPNLRKMFYELFSNLGGIPETLISANAVVGHFQTEIGPGCSIMTSSVITNAVKIGKGALINMNATIGHDSFIGDFVEISPGVNVSGNCKIGNLCTLGSNSCILPGILIGDNVTVGAGVVVSKNMPSNSMAVAVPPKYFGKS